MNNITMARFQIKQMLTHSEIMRSSNNVQLRMHDVFQTYMHGRIFLTHSIQEI